MESILNSYGKFLLAAVTMLALVLLLFAGITDGKGNRGVLQIAGAYLDTGQEAVEKDGGFEALETENRKPAPRLYLEGQENFATGRIVLTDIIKAEDYSGRPLPVQFVEVKSPSGQDMTNLLSENGETDFKERGIYVLRVSSIDDGNRKTTAQIKLPVQ